MRWLTHPGWVFYGVIGTVVFAMSLVGLFAGFRDGSFSVSSEEDTPEARSDVRWAMWSVFSGIVASAVLWPLSVPASLRGLLRALETGQLPTFSINRPGNPFRNVDNDRMRDFFGALGQWRESRPERFGDPHAVVACMNAVAQEGCEMLRDWPKKERRAALVGALGDVLDRYVEKAEPLAKRI